MSAERPDAPAHGAAHVGAAGFEAGDPVCWLNRVCDECGAFIEGGPQHEAAVLVCPRCGHRQALED